VRTLALVSDLNRAWWDERVPIHLRSELYDLDSFRSGRDPIRAFEDAELGPVEGRTLAHLQCHFGLDSLGWARRGARVWGLDFSEPAVDTANALAAELGLGAEFVCADVYDAVGALGGRRFQIVYTGLGALNWLPDIDRWAQTVASLIEPGGLLYLVEFHPFTWGFGDDELTFEHDYFRNPQGVLLEEAGTYADLGAITVHNRTVEWQHPLGEIVSAVIDAGLRLEFLHEHDYTLFPRWPFLEKHGFDQFRFPAERPRLPLMFSLRAVLEP
jgi:SAM-dependent methyltransferase